MLFSHSPSFVLDAPAAPNRGCRGAWVRGHQGSGRGAAQNGRHTKWQAGALPHAAAAAAAAASLGCALNARAAHRQCLG